MFICCSFWEGGEYISFIFSKVCFGMFYYFLWGKFFYLKGCNFYVVFFERDGMWWILFIMY